MPTEESIAKGSEVFEKLMGWKLDPKNVKEDFARITMGNLFGDVWTRPGLELRERSMITVAVASVVGVGVLGAIGGATPAHMEVDPVYMGMFLVCLALTGMLCVWQSRMTQRHHDELSELSRTDPLTGCLNRRGFSERLETELARAARNGGEVATLD